MTTTVLTAKNGQTFTIREATAEDAEELLPYARAVAAETDFFVIEPDEFPATVAKEREWIEGHLGHPGKLLLMAEAEGAIIGNVSFAVGPVRRLAHRGVLGIAVVKAWRGQGVGTALMETLLAWAAASPTVEKVSLEVFTENHSAIRLYRKLGFVEEGLRPREIKRGPGKYADALLMCRFVKPLDPGR